ncbi:MAG: PulJ/GspJ family protein [Pseudobdellovibrionaceae bacterium]
MNKKKLPKTSGFTLAEVTVALGVSSILIIFVASLLTQALKALRGEELSADKLSSEYLADKQLYIDLSNSFPSFTNLVVPPDPIPNTDMSTLPNLTNFFAYDLDPNFILNSGPESVPIKKYGLDVKLSIDPANPSQTLSRDFFLITQDTQKNIKNHIFLSAKQAYAPNSSNFVSLNQNGTIDSVAPHFWEEGKFLMLSTTQTVNEVDSNGDIDYTTPARNMIYLGVITGNELLALGLPVYIRTQSPQPVVSVNLKPPQIAATPSTQVPANVNDYLTHLPLEAGLSGTISVDRISVIRYRIKKTLLNGRTTKVLLRGAYDTSLNDFRDTVVASDIEEVSFHRSSLNSPHIEYSIKRSPL